MGSGEGRGLERRRLLPNIPADKHTGDNRTSFNHVNSVKTVRSAAVSRVHESNNKLTDTDQKHPHYSICWSKVMVLLLHFLSF